MPAVFSASGRVSLLYWGLWRERGTVRTSAILVTPCACSRRMNSANSRVECPMVNTACGCSKAFFVTLRFPFSRAPACGGRMPYIGSRSYKVLLPCGSLSFLSRDGAVLFLGEQPLMLKAAEPQSVMPRELRSQKENLCRVIHP